MKKLVFLGALLLGATASMQAQTNFRPGYVVTLAGDTLRGEVDTRIERRNARVCRFRASPEADITEYKPEQVRGYGTASGYDYQSYQLPDANHTTTFLQTLVLGKASLYRFTDKADQERFYVLSPAAPFLQPLLQHDTTITTSLFKPIQVTTQPIQTVTQTSKYLFRHVLWSVMADCPSVQVTLNQTKLKESQMVKLFTAYNSCVGKNQYVVKAAQSRSGFEVLAGGYQAHITTNSIRELEMKSGMSPTAGIGFIFAPARFNERFTLHVQALYVRQKYDAYYQTTGSGIAVGEKAERELHVRLTSMQLPFMLRYTMPKGVIRPFVQAGAAAALHLQKQAEQTETLQRTPNQPRTTSIELRSTGIGGVAGVGVAIPTGQRGVVQLEIRADLFDATSQVSSLLSGSRGLALLTSYTFGK